MQVEASLQSPRENLQIPYPPNFNSGDKTHKDDREIIAGFEPRYYTEPELAVIEAYLPKLPYSQSLIRTGAVLIGNDSLLAASHDDLDRIEVHAGLVGSRHLNGNGERSLRERVLIARELGYRGGIIKSPVTSPATTTAPVAVAPVVTAPVAATPVVTAPVAVAPVVKAPTA